MGYSWTTEKPTQPGWYVLKFHHLRREPEATKVVCLNIIEEDGVLYAEPSDDEGEYYAVDELADGLWKGPLDLEAP